MIDRFLVNAVESARDNKVIGLLDVVRGLIGDVDEIVAMIDDGTANDSMKHF